MRAHEIDYAISGNEMQYVEIELDPGESVIAEAGSMMMMDTGIEMETIFGDGSNESQGFMGKLFGAGKRLLTGESLFMTLFTNRAGQRQNVSFASPYPGRIIPLDLEQYQGNIICQKDSFLCAAKGCFLPLCAARARCGFNRCHSAGWRTASYPRRAMQGARKKEACWAASAVYWTETIDNGHIGMAMARPSAGRARFRR